MGSSRFGGGAAATSRGWRRCFVMKGPCVAVSAVPDGAAEAPLAARVVVCSAGLLVVPGRLLLTRMFGVGVCIVDTLLPVGVLCAEDADKGNVRTEDVGSAGDDKDGELVGEDKDGRWLPGISGRVRRGRRDLTIIKEAMMVIIVATTIMIAISIMISPSLGET